MSIYIHYTKISSRMVNSKLLEEVIYGPDDRIWMKKTVCGSLYFTLKFSYSLQFTMKCYFSN